MNLIDALKNLPHFDIDHWYSMCAVTLTVKQARKADNDTWIKIDADQCKKAFQVFMHRLDREVYGNAGRRFGKRLRVIPVVEKENFCRWNMHGAIELPQHLQPFQFEEMIRKCWSKVDWALPQIDFQEYADRGWLGYMLKRRQKSGLDAWSDCIVWECLHNPIVDA